MKKQSALEIVTNQLNKLSQIMLQQQKFNRKYIADVLQSRSSYDSNILLTDNNQQDIQIKKQIQSIESFDEQEQRSIKQKQNKDQFIGSQIYSNFGSEDWELQIPQGLGQQYVNMRNMHENLRNNNYLNDFIQNNSNNESQNQNQNENDKTKEMNKQFYAKLQRDLAQSTLHQQANANINKNINNQVNLDQQTTTKSIPVQQQKFYGCHIQGDKQNKCISISNKTNGTNIANIQQNIEKKFTNIYDNTSKNTQQQEIYCQSSAGATETLQMSLQKQMAKQININEIERIHKFKKYKQNNQKKYVNQQFKIVNKDCNKEKNGLIQKQIINRRPFTTIKPISKNQQNLQKLIKLDKNQLKKLKQKQVLIGINDANKNDKKVTNRKTKRQQITKNKSAMKLQNAVKNIKTMKKNQSNCQYAEQYWNTQSCVSQGNNKSNGGKTSSGKGWMKSTDKSNKKLNRVNIMKLNEFKKINLNNGAIKNMKISNNINKKQNAAQNINKIVNINNNNTQICNTFLHSLSNNKNQPQYKKMKHCHTSSKQSLKNIQGLYNHQNVQNHKNQEQKPKNFVQKLDFDKKVPIMQRIIQSKNIFKSYNIMNSNYTEIAKKMSIKYMKSLQKQIKQLSQQAIFKMKILTSIVVFFAQFFIPNNKNTMGLIAKCIQKQNQTHEGISYKYKQDGLQQQYKVQENKSLDSLIINLLTNPQQLISLIKTLPLHLYECNILSEVSITNLLNSYEEITQKLDEDLDFSFFMLKKQGIYSYFHALVQFIKFLQQNQLIQKTERKNLNRNKKSIIGYYSSRSKRSGRQGKSKNKNKNIKNIDDLRDQIKNIGGTGLKIRRKGCDSQRKLTAYDPDTERVLHIEALIKNSSKNKNKKQGKQTKYGMQKQSKMNISRQKDKNK